MVEVIAVSNATCAVVCGKWALELGYSQGRQVLAMMAGLLFGPLMLLNLYLYLLRKARKEGSAGGKFL